MIQVQGLAKGVVYLASDGCVQCDPIASDLLHRARRELSDSGTRLIVVQPGNARWDDVLEITSSFPALIYDGKACHNVIGIFDAMEDTESWKKQSRQDSQPGTS